MCSNVLLVNELLKILSSIVFYEMFVGSLGFVWQN